MFIFIIYIYELENGRTIGRYYRKAQVETSRKSLTTYSLDLLLLILSFKIVGSMRKELD